MEEQKKSVLPSGELGNVAKVLPHFFVIANGTDAEALALLKNISSPVFRAASFMAHQMENPKKDTTMDLLLSDERHDKRASKFRKMAAEQKGGDLLGTMKDIGSFALKLAPAILPLLL
jgi:hypothetical protein